MNPRGKAIIINILLWIVTFAVVMHYISCDSSTAPWGEHEKEQEIEELVMRVPAQLPEINLNLCVLEDPRMSGTWVLESNIVEVMPTYDKTHAKFVYDPPVEFSMQFCYTEVENPECYVGAIYHGYAILTYQNEKGEYYRQTLRIKSILVGALLYDLDFNKIGGIVRPFYGSSWMLVRTPRLWINGEFRKR